MPEELDQAIRDNAAGPRRAQGDSGSAEQHPLPDQIAADRYLASKQAAASPVPSTDIGSKYSACA